MNNRFFYILILILVTIPVVKSCPTYTEEDYKNPANYKNPVFYECGDTTKYIYSMIDFNMIPNSRWKDIDHQRLVETNGVKKYFSDLGCENCELSYKGIPGKDFFFRKDGIEHKSGDFASIHCKNVKFVVNEIINGHIVVKPKRTIVIGGNCEVKKSYYQPGVRFYLGEYGGKVCFTTEICAADGNIYLFNTESGIVGLVSPGFFLRIEKGIYEGRADTYGFLHFIPPKKNVFVMINNFIKKYENKNYVSFDENKREVQAHGDFEFRTKLSLVGYSNREININQISPGSYSRLYDTNKEIYPYLFVNRKANVKIEEFDIKIKSNGKIEYKMRNSKNLKEYYRELAKYNRENAKELKPQVDQIKSTHRSDERGNLIGLSQEEKRVIDEYNEYVENYNEYKSVYDKLEKGENIIASEDTYLKIVTPVDELLVPPRERHASIFGSKENREELLKDYLDPRLTKIT